MLDSEAVGPSPAMANAEDLTAPNPVLSDVRARLQVVAQLTFAVIVGAAIASTIATMVESSAASATVGLPVSGACSLNAGFDGSTLSGDDDFAPYPSSGVIASTGDDSALIGDACWLSADPPVPQPAAQQQSSPPVPNASQLPTAVGPAAVGPAAVDVPVANVPVVKVPVINIAAIGMAAAVPTDRSLAVSRTPLRPAHPHGASAMLVLVMVIGCVVLLGAGVAALSSRRLRHLTWR